MMLPVVTATFSGASKYIMPLVKLSFYDHFMVARGPSMLSIYRCAFLLAVLSATRYRDLFRQTRNTETLLIVLENSVHLLARDAWILKLAGADKG